MSDNAACSSSAQKSPNDLNKTSSSNDDNNDLDKSKQLSEKRFSRSNSLDNHVNNFIE